MQKQISLVITAAVLLAALVTVALYTVKSANAQAPAGVGTAKNATSAASPAGANATKNATSGRLAQSLTQPANIKNKPLVLVEAISLIHSVNRQSLFGV